MLTHIDALMMGMSGASLFLTSTATKTRFALARLVPGHAQGRGSGGAALLLTPVDET